MLKMLMALAIAALLCGTANAANWSNVHCDDARVIEFIKKTLMDMKSEEGDRLSKYLGNNSKMTATTVSAKANEFVCKVYLNLTYAGTSQKIRGRFVYHEFSGNRASVKFLPF